MNSSPSISPSVVRSGDTLPRDPEPKDLHPAPDVGSKPADLRFEHGYEPDRVDVGVPREVGSPCRPKIDRRIMALEAGTIEDPDRNTDPLGVSSLFDRVPFSGQGVEEHEETLAIETESRSLQLRQLSVEAETRFGEVPEQRHRLLHPGSPRGSVESEKPGEESRIDARLDVERALRVEHPLHPLSDDAGGGQGDEVARDDESGVLPR
jgi:hypothetical protein